MNIFLGIDAGSATVAYALINENSEILRWDYQFHKGQVEEALEKMLQREDLQNITALAVTTSTPENFNSPYRYDNQVAIIRASKERVPQLGSLLYVGAEKFGVLRFDSQGNYSRLNTNSSCAAGTGSFLDQQAGRLNLKGIEEFCSITQKNHEEIPQIATRCAVFAKTDLIHSQQEGYSLPAICDGLSRGLAKNLVETLFTGQEINSPMVICGGVSQNLPVIKHMEDLSGKKITRDSLSHIYGAYGAALGLLEEEDPKNTLKPGGELFQKIEGKTHGLNQALELKLSDYPQFDSLKRYVRSIEGNYSMIDVEVDIYQEFPENCRCILGVDIGSTSTKAVIIDEEAKVLAGLYTSTLGRPLEALKALLQCLDEYQETQGINLEVLGCGTTGSGRKFIGNIMGSDLILDEITAHARAAVELDSGVDTIIEIGGQDSKFTTLHNGMVTSSVMNNVCAAGTGSFLEEQAKKLNCRVTEYATRTMGVEAPISSDRCTVFMERDMNHFLNEGYTVNQVLASAVHSVRENYLQKVAPNGSMGNKIFFQGATAKNKALIAAFEQRLQKPIIVSKFCHLTGALGVALTLLDQEVGQSRFKGLELYKEEIPVELEICQLCNNNCKISIAQVRGKKVAYGFLCGREYQDKGYVNKNKSGFDLLAERRKILTVKEKKSSNYNFIIGIPGALYLLEDMFLWKSFFNLLGIKTLSSESLKNPLEQGKIHSEAEFCAPVTALHGHAY
ncbi:MAG: acyl-CoA dehydratase activase, partial [Spirochaetaceae bacterium]|nr:acyl-CoA dehydratase activase [Spirochaetaceae bacterium]